LILFFATPRLGGKIMSKLFYKLRHSIVSKLTLAVGLTLVVTISIWAYFNIKFHQQRLEEDLIGLAVFVFVVTSTVIFILMLKFVKYPINKLIDGTRMISKGEYRTKIDIEPRNELGQLALAINEMGKQISKKQVELNRQKDEYQKLFETVPCIITVQDKAYKLVGYNQEFAEKFDPQLGDFCFHAYKGRDKKCVVCPVEKTFEDGKTHQSEESGVSKDGTLKSWLVRTSPIKNTQGQIVAVMEMNLDITQRKQLEDKLEESEKKYHAIFNNIPNPVFVLDEKTLEVLDCNDSVRAVYGCAKDEVKQKSFLDMFPEDDRKPLAEELKTSAMIYRVKQLNKEGKSLFVNIRISPSEYPGQKVLLVTTSDITKSLETEQQLIQASKMATLGEMATGVAHELNQPLSVIKTASSFFMKKINKREPINDEILYTMSEEIDSHVDRASKIINHLRQFGRKSDMDLVETQVNDVLKKTFDIFSQQLTVRGIQVVWDIEEKLPTILADPDRLEQVFINFLINARDAIMDRWELAAGGPGDKTIFLNTASDKKNVIVEVCDTGTGIPASLADKIFEPFFTTKEVGKGTGLGLTISYGIIKDFGGNIHTLPHESGGTCFVVTFPKKKEDD
jgi:histidine kinase